MKINRTLIILSLLLVFCISLGVVSATGDISVNDINDGVATIESSAMNEEINAVGDEEILNSSKIANEIKYATGTYNITNDYQIYSTWEIYNDNVVIDGQGHTIYGNGKQAFYIKGSSVTIKNLNFVNCSAYNGGAIWFYGSGSVSGCSFVGCSASDGGAIYFYGSGSVSGCSFVNCSAYDYGGAIYFKFDGFVSDCIFDNNSAELGSAIYLYNNAAFRVGYNFFAFQDNVTEFPSGLIKGASLNKWVVLNGYASGDKYIANFVLNDGFTLSKSMPDYTARLVVGSEEKIITIHNNQFSCEYDPTKTYNIYSLNTGKLLTSLPAQEPIPPIPPAHLKVILTVDDIKGVSGSTVKVNVGVNNILGTPINEGTIIISLDGKEYTAKVIDGIATFNIIIPSKEGVYSANVLFNGEGTDYDNTTCNFTVTSVEDNTEDINKSVVSNNMENCGNPLVALLIALISLPIIRRRK